MSSSDKFNWNREQSSALWSASNGQDGSWKRYHSFFVIKTDNGGILCLAGMGVLLMCEALGSEDKGAEH